jgi:hypothetical protein
MATTERSDADQAATYEVFLRGTASGSLGSRSPGPALRAAPTQTVLFRCVRDVSELDTLLDRLRSSGLVVADIHGAPPPAQKSATLRYYEVRVRGELGAKLLRYLGWSHRLVTHRHVARHKVSERDLDTFLAQCAEAGLVVEQVHRT